MNTFYQKTCTEISSSFLWAVLWIFSKLVTLTKRLGDSVFISVESFLTSVFLWTAVSLSLTEVCECIRFTLSIYLIDLAVFACYCVTHDYFFSLLKPFVCLFVQMVLWIKLWFIMCFLNDVDLTWCIILSNHFLSFIIHLRCVLEGFCTSVNAVTKCKYPYDGSLDTSFWSRTSVEPINS